MRLIRGGNACSETHRLGHWLPRQPTRRDVALDSGLVQRFPIPTLWRHTMTLLRKITGSCLCGTVAYTVHGPYKAFYLCHCTRCRKKTGSAHASNIFASAESFCWTSGEDSIKRYNLPEAEAFATWFCSECGSAVPHESRRGPLMVIPAGTLDGDPEFAPQHNIYWHDRAGWYDEGKAAPCCDGGPP